MELTYIKTMEIKGRGKILVFKHEKDEKKLPRRGDKITVNGQDYVVRGVELSRNLLDNSIISDIGVCVKDYQEGE